MIFAALTEAAGRNELILTDGGLCRFHKRKDGIIVVREIIVLPEKRRKGLATRMINEVCIRHRGATVQAKCPVEYESNHFWRAMGFKLIERTDKLNVWQLS